MRHVVTWNGDKHKILLPDTVPDGVPFAIAVDGQESEALWLRREGTLILRGVDGVERLFRIRNRQVTRFEGDEAADVRAEVQSGAAMRPVSVGVAFDMPSMKSHKSASREQVVRSQITGKVLQVLVKVGDTVAAGTALLTIEAMKMENRVFAAGPGQVLAVSVKSGDAVQTGKELLRVGP